MISIVLPVYNMLDMTYECIMAIREHTRDCEIIVVDNGSDPPFKAPFSEFKGNLVIRNETNLGFPVAVNQGIRAAKGDIIISLNNDVIVTPRAINRLAQRLDEFSIVGPVTNYCAGLQCVQIPVYQNREELDKEAEVLAQAKEGEVEEVNFVIGFCMAFKKSLFDEIGPFDESMWPCSGEEVDFCFRARAAGHRVAIARDIYLHHEGSITFKDLQDKKVLDYREVCRKVDEHVAKKWGKDYWQRQAVGIIAPIVAPGQAIRLNLGCGYAHIPDFINIDNRLEVNPDLVCDILKGLPYEDNSVDEVRAYDFLEHCPLGQTISVITEIWRVLKPGGRFESFTPSTDGRGAFQDPTHASFWNRNSWLYFSDSAHRGLYGIQADFEIESIEDTEPNPVLMIIHTHVIARKR